VAVRWVLRSALAAVAVCGAARSRAAELRWSSPEDCAWSPQFAEQVEAQIGTTLAAVEGIDFEVVISRETSGRWRLTLVSIEQPAGERRVRALAGESCAEVTDAGAVALAMAIRAKSEEERAPEPATPPEKAPAEPVRPPARRAPRSSLRSAPERSSAPAVAFATAGAVADLGALPGLSLGVEVDAGVAWQRLRLMAFGSMFAPNEASGPSGRGGEFQLWLAGVLACLERPVGRVGVLACTGYEIGALSAEGTGVTDPRSESATWHALRGDLGAVLPLGSGFSGVLRAGVAVPLVRREFVLDASEVVHRPSAVTGRALAAFSVDF
jgi:hypothetical protein